MKQIDVLDNGYVALVESWGSDERIVESARMSTGKGFLGWEPGPCPECEARGYTISGCFACEGLGKVRGDAKLLRYLYTNNHATPFEMGGLVIEVQAPIFVFREWHRHRTQSYNELSARYTPLPALNYIPTVERLMLNSKTNKQAGTVADAKALTQEKASAYREWLADAYDSDQHLYETALQMGVPKELARIHLPVGRYSRMRASANLRNWLGFLTLRMAPNAQWEIRSYANVVGQLVAERFPRTWALFKESH
jgi:thymidylate synthase (FAD)